MLGNKCSYMNCSNSRKNTPGMMRPDTENGFCCVELIQDSRKGVMQPLFQLPTIPSKKHTEEEIVFLTPEKQDEVSEPSVGTETSFISDTTASSPRKINIEVYRYEERNKRKYKKYR
ncbi:unnamed protein product, partial [Callosobruchus maculatus]